MCGSTRYVVEVTGVVYWDWAVAEVCTLEKVELNLRVNVEREAHLRSLGKRTTKHVARVGSCRLAIRSGDVAEHTRGRVDLAAPRKNLEGRRVWHGQHVRFVGTCQSLDGRAIEAEAFCKGAFNFGRRDSYRLESSRHIGEPKANEFDASFFNSAKDEFCLLVHQKIPLVTFY